jgi:hypothetical protein
MKRFFTLLLGGCLAAAGTAQAQNIGEYVLTVKTDTYTPLVNGTNLTQTPWDDTLLKVPLNFTFHFGGLQTDTLIIDDQFLGANICMRSSYDYDSTPVIFPLVADLIDRGYSFDSTTLSSPIRYEWAVDSGKKVMKLEWANAGFYDEYYNLGTQNDSMNVQFWAYENDAFEIRFGPSQDTSQTDSIYFYPFTKFATAISLNYNFLNDSLNSFYVLAGDPAQAYVDSVPTLYGVDSLVDKGFDSHPGEGMVYRFAKPVINTGTGALEVEAGWKVYPTVTTGALTLEADRSKVNTAAACFITDLQGRVVYKGTLMPDVNRLDISNFASGNYVLCILQPGIKTYTKIIKL